MPRDITILSPQAPDGLDLATAARAIDESYGVRPIDGATAHQVFARGGRALLTVYGAQELATVGEIERLLPDPPEVRLPVFWIDASAPLGDDGEAGVSVALRLALALDAVCIVEDD
ncbi:MULTISPECIES: hypothetical protein [unclassified Frigoribacterium]|uniref:hypothetical protein n=1 Tax=unclassified Frigoribacterium TaxID=2627005 RepID=UPI0006FB6BF0|nr:MULTISPECIES: hypothetical protein [unclassified Frigoribacterium]KQO82427.1 hypothetical protein ASF17_04910 [Frigoribacterium sp. Leaf263]KQR64890.1 hypothetical protein ASF89_10710 [Frigoribacterium sp. Leaf172]